jgi:hypothetical protein
MISSGNVGPLIETSRGQLVGDAPSCRRDFRTLVQYADRFLGERVVAEDPPGPELALTCGDDLPSCHRT